MANIRQPIAKCFLSRNCATTCARLALWFDQPKVLAGWRPVVLNRTATPRAISSSMTTIQFIDRACAAYAKRGGRSCSKLCGGVLSSFARFAQKLAVAPTPIGATITTYCGGAIGLAARDATNKFCKTPHARRILSHARGVIQSTSPHSHWRTRTRLTTYRYPLRQNPANKASPQKEKFCRGDIQNPTRNPGARQKGTTYCAMPLPPCRHSARSERPFVQSPSVPNPERKKLSRQWSIDVHGF